MNDVVDSPQQDVGAEVEEVFKPKRPTPQKAQPPGTPREFSGNEFRLLFDVSTQRNVNITNDLPPITGNEQVDAHIRQLAVNRGYKVRAQAITSELVRVNSNILLQPEAREAWLKLEQAAEAAGITIRVSSGYRGVDMQREIFLSRIEAIVDWEGQDIGSYDEQLESVMDLAAPPGFSKHHSGHTIDFKCAGFGFYEFSQSPCFEWLSADNYLQAKVHGFIPSYPDDAQLQGPNPEQWEYVWIGTESLLWQ